MVCYLENDDKENSNHMFSTDAVISLNSLCPAFESTDTASLDTERELYFTSKHQKKLMTIFTKYCSIMHKSMKNKCMPLLPCSIARNETLKVLSLVLFKVSISFHKRKENSIITVIGIII